MPASGLDQHLPCSLFSFSVTFHFPHWVASPRLHVVMPIRWDSRHEVASLLLGLLSTSQIGCWQSGSSSSSLSATPCAYLGTISKPRHHYRSCVVNEAFVVTGLALASSVDVFLMMSSVTSSGEIINVTSDDVISLPLRDGASSCFWLVLLPAIGGRRPARDFLVVAWLQRSELRKQNRGASRTAREQDL